MIGAGLGSALRTAWEATETAAAATSLRVAFPAGALAPRLTWEETAVDETGYSVERRDVTAAGAFAEIAALGPGLELYDDTLGDTHTYAYRIKTVGGVFDGEYSNIVYTLTGAMWTITDIGDVLVVA